MKILYVTSAFPPESQGGTELHAFYLAREMARQHEVQVLTRVGVSDHPDYHWWDDDYQGLAVRKLNYNFGDASSFEWIYQNPNVDRLFGEWLDEWKPDLVHVHHLTCLSTGMLAVAKARGLALCMTLHDFWMVCPRGQRIDPELEICETIDRLKCQSCLARLWPHHFPGVPHEFPKSRVLDELASSAAPAQMEAWDTHIRAMLSHCDLLLTPSEFHREKMLEFSIDEQRIEALPHGLDRELLRGEKDFAPRPKTVGFIGSVIPSKGVHLVVDAMNELADAELSFEVWGADPPFHGDTEYVARMQASTKPGVRIEFRGAYQQSELPMILSGLDILVVPSLWWESFCLTIREGLLAGCIVIAADHGPMAEALDGGRNGLLFEPGNAADLERCLREVLDEPERRAQLVNRGAVVKSIEQNAREMLEKYRTALRRAGRDPDLAHPGDLRPDLEAAYAAELSRDPSAPRVTVFIPTWNGGALFDEVLRKIFEQKTDFEFEVLAIDSGSKDQTLDILAKYPVRVLTIPNSEFNHGLTRNRGVREARGEIVALLTQDAVPYNEHWLQNLVSNFDDPEVAGAYCHQLPREDCNPFQRDRLAGWTYGEGERESKQISSRAQYEAMSPWDKYRTIAFDDVASCVRKSVMEKIPFEKRQFGEDVAWARQAIFGGWKLVMDPRAVVVHSHNNPIWYEFKRVYLDHQNLNDLVGMHLIRRFSDVLRFTVTGTGHLGGVIRRSPISRGEKIRWWIKTPFYSLGQNLGQYLGARSNLERRRGIWGFIDRRLKKGV